MNDFGNFLFQLRKEKGITQAELANTLGVSNKAVSKWETGEAMPETSLLLPIARIFNVSVDELLNGKHAVTSQVGTQKNETHNEKQNNSDAKFDDDTEEKETFSDALKNHLFTRGKDEENKTLPELICGAICASVVLVGVLVYLILGITLNVWHPFWVIVPMCALSCGIIGLAFDLGDKQKIKQKIEKGQNPYTGAICGIVMLSCIISYLLLGSLLSLWHPLWIIPVCGAVACALIGSFGEVVYHKKHK